MRAPVAAAALAAQFSAAAADKNVLSWTLPRIVVDDLRPEMRVAYRQQHMETPAFDRLARHNYTVLGGGKTFHYDHPPYFDDTGKQGSWSAEKFWDMYPDPGDISVAQVQVRDPSQPEMAFHHGDFTLANGSYYPGNADLPWPVEVQQIARKGYYAAVSQTDYCIGRVLGDDASELLLKNASFSQWPSCGIPGQQGMCISPRSTLVAMGYTVRALGWRYTAWVPFNTTTYTAEWGAAPLAVELYDHSGTDGGEPRFDFDDDGEAGARRQSFVKGQLSYDKHMGFTPYD
eukprot:gene36335-47038_t